MAKVKCSFCSKDIDREAISQGKELVFLGVNDEILICKECVEQCKTMLEKISSSKTVFENEDGELEEVTPKAIKDGLDEWIIGQDEAKITLSTALYNHYKRLNQKEGEIPIEKSNIILVGSTGSGKTSTVNALAKQLKLPLIIEDVTGFSATGYVGGDVEDILKRLLDAANGDKELAQRGIVLLDEGDKIRRKAGNNNATKDVNGEGVQQRLLKLVEGGIYDIKTKKGIVKFNTKNVLFILGGSFEGIEKIIEKRLKDKSKKNYGGFTGEVKSKSDEQAYNNLIVKVKHEDLKNFGMTPELLGRFPVVTALRELSEEALVEILTKPKNAITKQYEALFKKDGVDLSFTDEALIAVAKEAKARKIGARALRSIVEETLKKAMFEVPGTDTKLVQVDYDLNVIYYTQEQVNEMNNEVSKLTNKE